jgi:hypothetical protein
MSFQIINRRTVLARGKFAPTGNETTIPVPGSGATVTLFDSTLNGNGLPPIPGLPFDRIQVNLYSSADSAANGVVFSSAFDGANAASPSATNWRQQSTQSFTNASGPASWDYLMKGSHAKITYQNSANVLTAWEVEVVGIFDRDPGT